MRLLPVATAAVSCALIGAGGAATAHAMSRASSFQRAAATLERTWTVDEREGVPESSVVQVRRILNASPYMHTAAWSPLWWTDDGSALLGGLHRETAAIWTAAVAVARSRADAIMTAWSEMEMEFGAYVSKAAATSAARWEAQLTAARTPAQIDELVTTWAAQVSSSRNGARVTELTDASGPYRGVETLLAAARHAVSVAHGDNLSAGAIPSLIATLSADSANTAAAVAAIRSMVADLEQLDALITLDGKVAAELQALDAKVQLAAAHLAAGSAGFADRFSTLAAALRAGGDASRLQEVAAQIASTEAAVTTALAAVGCGHDVPAGKVIEVTLATQDAVFYDDGCVAGSSPITSGMAGLRTPAGTYHIYAKDTPITFYSQWPKSSPYYYAPETAEFGMEFASGGFFFHDAPWEPTSAFGPGSEDGAYASHGCVHVPTATMQWLYAWSPIGTTVIITD